MKTRFYRVLRMAIEEGIAYGVNRSFKHTDTPSIETIIDNVEGSVMNSISEWFDFGDEDGNETVS